MSEESLWGTDSGLVSDYEGTVVDAWFAVDPNINDSPTFLFLKMKTDNEQFPEITERYNCGPDWRSYDGGESVIHPTRVKWNNRSQAGILVDKAIALVGDPIEQWDAPTKAATWLGTQWYVEAVSKPYKLRDGTEGVSVRNYPAKFLGKVGVDAPAPREEGGVDRGSLAQPDSPVMTIIASMAKDLPHREWVDKVLEVEGVMGDDDLVRKLPDTTDTGLYETLRRTK